MDTYLYIHTSKGLFVIFVYKRTMFLCVFDFKRSYGALTDKNHVMLKKPRNCAFLIGSFLCVYKLRVMCV